MKNPLRTLQGRFAFYLSVLVVAMMSALACWNISREKGLMENAIAREGKALAESFAISCTNTMLYEEIGLVEEGGLLDNYISDLMQRKNLDIVYAMILDTKGTVRAHNSLTEVGNLYKDQVTQHALSSWNTLLQYPSPTLLDISTPLAISTKRWGTLRLGISTENLKKEVSGLVWKYAFYTLGFILLTTTIIVFLFGFITHPLKSLSKEMDMASTKKTLSPVPSKREDEIGILQRSFYRMLERIGENEKDRERTQRNLFLTEKMVAIGKLTAGMAHEINNPLGGILNCIYHFKKGIPSPERQREYLDLMEDGIKRIQKTVTNLLEYARNPNPERSTTEIAPLIEKALSLLDYQICKNRISIERDISVTIPPVHVDRDQMAQILVNILLNAIQAMEQGGVLTVNARNIDERLLITVSDTGSGIPNDVLPNIFDPFFTTKGEGKGTGLGLWISQGMIERHGWTIQVISKEKKGTTIEIQLPLRSTQEKKL